MGMEELKVVTEVKEPGMNGTKTTETVAEKKGENVGVKEMEGDKKDESGVDAEGKTIDDVKENEKPKEENIAEVEEEPKSEAMEEGKSLDGNDSNKEEDATEGKTGDVKMDDVADVEDAKVKETEKIKESEDGNKENKEELEKSEEKKEDKKAKKKGKARGSKKRIRAKSDGSKSSEKKRKVVEKVVEPRTPAAPIDRPIRERKSVDRLVATVEKDASKELQIEKGQGTSLKDIPNVAYKMSRKKNEETFKALHSILFGRRAKAAPAKQNISRFSGFVWHENEEKQKLKVKEKFDKLIKEKLLEFCDVLDIPITKTTSKKEDVLATLMDFLEAPRATSTVLLSEQDRGRKRKRPSPATKGASASSKGSVKSSKKTGNSSRKGEKATHVTEDESEEEEKENGTAEISEDEKSERSESEEKKEESENDNEEEIAKEKASAGKSKKETKKKTPSVKSSGKAAPKNVITPTKPRSIPKGTPRKSSASRSKTVVSNDAASKVFSRTKKSEEPKTEKSPVSKKSATKETSGTKVVKRTENTKEDKLKPSDDELKDAICELLKEVDFNTATFTDILNKLAKKYNTDLLPRKSSIKRMVQDQLTKLAEDDDEEDHEDTQPAGKRIKT